MKLLLLGKGGQVGWELQRSLAPLGELVALDHESKEFHADFSQPERLLETVRAVRPDVIVNAAAHTAVGMMVRFVVHRSLSEESHCSHPGERR